MCLQIGLASVAPAATLACPPLLQVFAQMCIFFFNQVACFQEYLRVHSRRSLMPVPAPRRRRRPSSGGHHGHNTQPPAKKGALRRRRRSGGRTGAALPATSPHRASVRGRSWRWPARTCVPEPRRGGPAPPSDLSARSQPRLMVLPIITFIFYDVSGGPFGIEDSVRAGGALPLLLLLLFLLVAEGFLVAAVAGQATRARAAARARLREGSGGSVEAAQARRLQVHIHLPRRAGDDDATTVGLDRSRRSLSFSGTVSHPYFPYRINRKSITPEKFRSVRGSRGSGPPARSHARRWYNRRTRRLMVDARSWSLVRGAWR